MTHDKKLDQAAKAAWLSYVANRTQDEIAQEMGVSRQTAQRLVAQAMAAGIVKVRIDHPLAQCLEIGQRLRERFGLRYCEVVPAMTGMTGVAMAVAALIEEQLARPDPITLAIGTGRTLDAGVRQLVRIDCPQHRIVSLTGNIAPDGSTAFYNVLFLLSARVSAKTFPLIVPVVAASSEERDALHRQPGNSRVMEMARKADIALVGIGCIGRDAPLVKDGFLSMAEMDDLMRQGAAGEIVGRAYDRDGRLLPLNDRVASADLPQGRDALIVAAATGADKHEAILGAIRGGMISGLITDEAAGEWLLDA